MIKSAIISPCQKFRYSLTRDWSDNKQAKTLIIIGLNPSTADAANDDPTIRRCVTFAKELGFNKLVMMNLFAFRATDPKNMKRAADPIGPDNDKYLNDALKEANLIIAAWGNHGDYNNRSSIVAGMLNDLMCFGITKKGEPKHPLYLKSGTKPISFCPKGVL